MAKIKTPQVTLANNLPKILGTTIAKSFMARLGDPSQNYKVSVDDSDKLGLVYIHPIGENPNSTYTAENTAGITKLVPNTLVEVKPSDNGRYKIIGYGSENAEYMSGVDLSDQEPVFRSQIRDGGLIPNDSSNVQYVRTYYVIDNIIYLTSDQTTGNLIDGSTDDTSAAAIQPPSTASKAIMVLVQIEPITDTITYKQSAEFPASYSDTLIGSNGLLPALDTGNFLAGYVKLISGMTVIKREHTYSLPDIFRSSGGAVSELSDLTDVGTTTPTNGNFLVADGDSWESRALVQADISDLDIDLTTDVSGILPVANGGTNASSASGARTSLDVQQTLSGLSLTGVTVATDDKVLIQDTSDSNNLKTVTTQSIADLAGGSLAFAETDGMTNTNSTSSSFADITGASLTVNLTGRDLEVSCVGIYVQHSTTNSCIIQLDVSVGSTFTQLLTGSANGRTEAFIFPANFSYVIPASDLTTGSHTFKLQLQRSAGSGTVTATVADAIFQVREIL